MTEEFPGLPVSKAMRIERFAETYSRTANAKESALAAGYAKSSAYAAATRMLKDPVVIKLLRARFIDRDVHAEQTYRDLIELADLAMTKAREICRLKGVEVRDFAILLETAGKAVERLARAEGILMPPPADKGTGDGRQASLQSIVQEVYKSVGPGQRLVLAAHLEHRPQAPPLDTAEEKAGGNGNGHAH